MSTFSVIQGSSPIQISSTGAGFQQDSDSTNRYYLYQGGGSQNDEFFIDFADGSGIKLTDFNRFGYSNSFNNVIGIPSSPEGGFGSSINIIGGSGYNSTFDIYDSKSGALLLDDYKPQNGISGYFDPYAQFGETNGQLTVRAPTGSGVVNIVDILDTGVGYFRPEPTSYIDGRGYTQTAGTAQLSSQYISGGSGGGGGGGAPWVFNLSLPTPSAPVCFVLGTLIKTAYGTELPIQGLQIGDIIQTSKGPLPIKWIAIRTVWKHSTSEIDYKKALPVRIQAGSLGGRIHCDDLLVSRFHGIWVDGKVVNAICLENGVNIVQTSVHEFPDCIQYFHLEFEEEVLVEANGVWSCSYANENNRRYFDNYPEFISRYCNADFSASSSINSGPRNRPSIQGHKERVKRSWISSKFLNDSHVPNQAASAQLVTF